MLRLRGGPIRCNIFHHLKSKRFILLNFLWSLQVILGFNISCASLCTRFFNEYDWITTPLNLRVLYSDPNCREYSCSEMIRNAGASTHDHTIIRGYFSFPLPFPTVSFLLLIAITSFFQGREASCGWKVVTDMRPRTHSSAQSVAWCDGDIFVGGLAPCCCCHCRCCSCHRRLCRCCHFRLVIVVDVVVVVAVAVSSSLFSSLSSSSPSRCRRRFRIVVVVVVVGVSGPRRHCRCWRLIWQSGWSNLRVWKKSAYRQKNRYNHFSRP